MLVWIEAFDEDMWSGPDKYENRVKAIPTLATLSNATAPVTIPELSLASKYCRILDMEYNEEIVSVAAEIMYF
jgi:hypothetical protein